MPEIGEVARIVHFLRKHLLNRTISSCTAFDDPIIYGKVGCSSTAFQSHVQDRKVTGAGQQGKYFYLTFDKAPHAVMHLGMTGWIKFTAEDTRYYKKGKVEDGDAEEEEWPPKYAKFLLKCDAGKVDGEQREAVEVAFVDARRLARIRLVDCKAEEIRQHSPLKENGPDPVVDKDVLNVEFLSALMRRKRVPIKALLLDQANISGVGNWVADEVLYQARIHPEQYCNSFSDEEIQRLHDSLMKVCTLAVETLADSSQFPEDWLMKFRWDKGKKNANVLPNGNKIVHIKVGGRTSAVVPNVQKKTGAVAGDAREDDEEKPAKGRKRKAKVEEDEEDEEDDADVEEKKPAKRASRGRKADEEDEAEVEEKKPAKRASRGKKADETAPPPAKKTARAKKVAAKVEEDEEDADASAEEGESAAEEKPKAKGTKAKAAKGKKAAPKKEVKPPKPGERRSTRTQKK